MLLVGLVIRVEEGTLFFTPVNGVSSAGAAAGVEEVTAVFTLGDCTWISVVFTLGNDVTGGGDGNMSALFNVSTIFNNIFWVRSPASRVGVVLDGGDVKMVMISVTDYLR